MSTDTTSNPYTSPGSAPASVVGVDFAPIIRRWERLRLIYNGLLISLVLGISFLVVPGHASDPGYWVAIVLGGFIANLCFLTGPAIEGYGTHFRIWNGAFTIVLFLAGLGLTGFFAIAFIAEVTGNF